MIEKSDNLIENEKAKENIILFMRRKSLITKK